MFTHDLPVPGCSQMPSSLTLLYVPPVFLQIKTKAKIDFKEGKRDTEVASTEEVRIGTCANLRDVRFFGAWVPAIWDKQESIPRRLLGEVMELVANSYDPVE